MNNKRRISSHEHHGGISLADSTLELAFEEAASSSPEEIPKNKKRLVIAICISFVFFIVELCGGYFSHSLALFSDAFHLLSDMAGFAISLAALYLAQQPATKRHSFGFHRAEILGAIVSILLVWILTGVLVVEAINRLKNPTPIDGKLMAFVALFGVLVNVILGVALGHGHDHHDESHHHHHNISDHGGCCQEEHDVEEGRPLLNEDATLNRHAKHVSTKRININVHSALIHVIGDLISSIGVFISSLIIWYDPSKMWIDPICTFFFSAIVLFTTLRLLYSSVRILMEATPPEIDTVQLAADLLKIKQVCEVHDLHVWCLTMNRPSMAVHIAIEDVDSASGTEITLSDYLAILDEAQKLVSDVYGISHSTIQVEVLSTPLKGANPKKSSSSQEGCLSCNSESATGRPDANQQRIDVVTDSKDGDQEAQNKYRFVCRPLRCNSSAKDTGI